MVKINGESLMVSHWFINIGCYKKFEKGNFNLSVNDKKLWIFRLS